MGCFNTVTFRCPHCGKLDETQTKAGSCAMSRTPVEVAEMAEIADVLGVYECEFCKQHFKIDAVVAVHVIKYFPEDHVDAEG